jgi:hypothetical protein
VEYSTAWTIPVSGASSSEPVVLKSERIRSTRNPWLLASPVRAVGSWPLPAASSSARNSPVTARPVTEMTRLRPTEISHIAARTNPRRRIEPATRTLLRPSDWRAVRLVSNSRAGSAKLHLMNR